MIYISAFSLTGTADFSSIKTELQNLERTIGNLRVPQIKTDVATPNFSNFFSAIDKAEKQATIKIKPEIDNSFMGGLSNSLTGQKGKFSSVGKELGSSLTMGMQQQFGMAGGVASSLATALGPVGIAATAGTAALIGLGAASVNAARGWETLMAGVSKTTGAEGAALTQLSNTLLNLSKEMPIAQAEIAKIATVGGTLGVKQSDLPKFVKDTAMASAGWGMSGEEAANSIAGISNAFKVPIADAQKFGSVINTMADNVGGSEKELADFLVRASGIATTFDEGIASTTAFGAVLASINMPMEVAATGLQSMMAYAMAPSSPERLEQWASMMNVTVDQLKAKLEQDLYGTLIESSNAIATVGTETEQQQARIAIWGEGGARVSSGLVGMQDKYTEALKMSNEQLATGSSLAQAFGAQGVTVDAKWQKFTNTMSTALIHVGTAALPVLGQVLDTMSGLVAAADDFAATTLPAWAQSTTDWVNETLGMEEDTAEEAAARKAKIARTREKTVAKVADTTGYQSYAEAQASAANLGQGTGNSYVDGLNSALDTGLPKALTDAYLGDALKVAKSAGKEAGDVFGEGFLKAVKDAKVSEDIGALIYDSAGNVQMSDEEALDIVNSRSTGKSRTTTERTLDTFFGKYSIQKYVRKTKATYKGGSAILLDDSGEEILSEAWKDTKSGYGVSFSDAADALEKAIKPVFLDMPKFMRGIKDEMSGELEDILSDGVVQWEEKGQIEEAIKKLEDLQVRAPVEFDQANLDDQLTKLEATRLGLNVDLLLGTDKLESDFYKWAEENANVIATYLANNTSYMEAAQGRPEYQWLELNPDAVSLMEEYNAALSSHEPGQVSKLPSLQNDLLKLHPELQDQAFWTTKVNVAQAELNEHFVILDGTVVGIDKDGKAVSEGFQAELPVLAAHGTGLIADAEAVASHTRSVLSSIAAMSNVHYGTLPTSANYALPGTTARAYNAYKPTTPIYAPLESLNLTKFAKGGISLTKGIAEVDANELHIPKDQLPCAVSSMYDVLENPNLFFPSGLGTITDSSGSTYSTQAKLESLGKVIDTTKISFESANSGILKLSSGATYVSDRWMEEYDRFTITAPGTGFQSSSKRGYVPVSISEAAKENIIYNPFTDESNWAASGMDAKISAMQQQYAGKSSVMPSGANTKPDWIVEASNGVIPKYSEGVLNSLAVEYDSLQAVNTEKVRYADLQGTELRNILMQSDAIIDATAAGGEYCEAMSKFGITTEEASRTAEKNGMFQKAYIGPSKYYEQAKEYFAGNTVTEAINKTTKQVSDVENAVDESANEYGKYGRKLDALTDGLFATVGALRGSAQSDLYGDKMPMSQSAKWYMDEFYTVEYGLGQCVSYLSDFAIMQEGVFSDVLFQPSYIGKTAGYAGAGKGGLPGYSNIAEILPQNALEMQEAASRFADAADMTDANYQLSKIGESSEATKEATEESAKELKEVSKNTQQVAEQNAAISDLYGQAVGGSSGWGGTSVGGGGGWIGTSGVYSGMNGSVYYGSTVGGWGAQASNSISGNTGTVSIGQGALYYAEGGITDHPVFGVFGEAGREAFVPISDRAAGRRILPQVMRELGIRTFATGGIAGSGGLSAIMESVGPTTITYAPTINADGLSKSQAQSLIDRSQDKFLEKVAKKQVLSKRRRG